ncbi:MAG: glycosyltransferase [Acidaminococcales bacterium]|jgi:glycosyltransferase involved in cell wall biosynthesis|nr:glycosyltransferase [Acidaminococcales bacterium]
MQELISIIIPVYNVEQYIHKCVDSVINQSHKDLEIILVDDGSPDGCGRICDDYALKDARVKVIHQANRGLSGARNAGLAVARGKYVAFVDSDDYILKDMYADLLRLALKHGADMVVSDFYEITEAGGKKARLNNYSAKRLNKLSIEDVRRLTLLDKLPPSVCVKLYKAYAAKDVGFYPGVYFEDLIFSARIIFKINKVVFTDKAYYCCNRTERESITSLFMADENKFARRKYSWFVAWREREALARAHFPQNSPLMRAQAVSCSIRALLAFQGLDGWEEEKGFCLEYLYAKEQETGLADADLKHRMLWWCYKNCRTFCRVYTKLSVGLHKLKNKLKICPPQFPGRSAALPAERK